MNLLWHVLSATGVEEDEEGSIHGNLEQLVSAGTGKTDENMINLTIEAARRCNIVAKAILVAGARSNEGQDSGLSQYQINLKISTQKLKMMFLDSGLSTDVLRGLPWWTYQARYVPCGLSVLPSRK